MSNTRSGTELKQPRKCYACGGFLPWENWGKFWQSNMDVGNGGVLQRPASDYDELNKASLGYLSALPKCLLTQLCQHEVYSCSFVRSAPGLIVSASLPCTISACVTDIGQQTLETVLY